MKELPKKTKTAFYVFDINTLDLRIDRLRRMLPENVSLCYAVKANPFIAGELKQRVERFEVCSPGEAKICERIGIADKMTVISGVYKTPSFIDEKIRNTKDTIYTVESLKQFEQLRVSAIKYGKRLPILLRLTNGSQFGINREDIEEIVKNRKNYSQLNILGIQFFSGTQKTSSKKLQRELSKLDLFLTALYDKYGFIAKELEYGPGFPAVYFLDQEFSEDEYLNDFSFALSSMQNRPKITLELGRAIASSCGKYYTHIVDLKTNNNQNYIITDGGMHQLVYFGQHMAMRKPTVSIVGKETMQPTKEWNICGCICSMNDIIVKQMPLPDVETGDVICFENTGAYSVTEGISLFLSREIPAVFIKNRQGELKTARKPFLTYKLNYPTEKGN